MRSLTSGRGQHSRSPASKISLQHCCHCPRAGAATKLIDPRPTPLALVVFTCAGRVTLPCAAPSSCPHKQQQSHLQTRTATPAHTHIGNICGSSGSTTALLVVSALSFTARCPTKSDMVQCNSCGWPTRPQNHPTTTSTSIMHPAAAAAAPAAGCLTSATSPLSYMLRLLLSVERSTCLAAAGSEMTRKLLTGPVGSRYTGPDSSNHLYRALNRAPAWL